MTNTTHSTLRVTKVTRAELTEYQYEQQLATKEEAILSLLGEARVYYQSKKELRDTITFLQEQVKAQSVMIDAQREEIKLNKEGKSLYDRV